MVSDADNSASEWNSKDQPRYQKGKRAAKGIGKDSIESLGIDRSGYAHEGDCAKQSSDDRGDSQIEGQAPSRDQVIFRRFAMAASQ